MRLGFIFCWGCHTYRPSNRLGAILCSQCAERDQTITRITRRRYELKRLTGGQARTIVRSPSYLHLLGWIDRNRGRLRSIGRVWIEEGDYPARRKRGDPEAPPAGATSSRR